MKISLEQVRNKLIQVGLKATHQRMVVLQALVTSEVHPSADWIFDSIHASNPSISLATIYNTLDSFVEAGLVKRVLSGKGSTRYDARMDDHHHLICSNTQEIIDFYDEGLNKVIRKYLKDKNIENFELQDMQLHVRGLKLNPGKKVKINF